MVDFRKGWFVLAGLGFSLTAFAAAAPPGIPEPPKEAGPVIKSILTEERSQVEKEIAARMMKRADAPTEKRARLEMEIDLRIIERAMLSVAANAKAETNEQAVAWLRSKQIREVVRGVEDTLGQDAGALSASQKDALAQLHKLSFQAAEMKNKDMDEFCKSAGLILVNCVNATPVNASAITIMRPKVQANVERNADEPASLGELTGEVQRLAAISVPLRQQLLALAASASAAEDKDESKALYGVLVQSIALARGLQSNTAVGNDARAGIEGQLAEGIVLFSDPRTRDAGKSRIEALGQYRQTLTRIGKLGLSKEQMDQFAPAFAWAQANPEAGAKLLGTVEDYVNACSRWELMPKDATVPASLKRPFEDIRSQFGKDRTAFMQAAARVASTGNSLELQQTLEDMQRVQSVTEDLQTMAASLDTINSYKIKPVGGLERKITTAALAAVSTTASTNRNDGQKFLNSVHSLARLSQALSSKPLTDVPPAILQSWGGSATATFEKSWKGIIVDLANSLGAGSIELDKAKVARLETAMELGDTLRTAARFEAAMAKAPMLARWADWSIDPASLTQVMVPYKESVAGAIFGFASDSQDAVDKWTRLAARYEPLTALVLRDAGYAEQCQTLPIGFPADIGRLITPFEGAPFSTERYASYSIGTWSILEKNGETEVIDRVRVSLAKRIARDLRLPDKIEETAERTPKRPKFGG